MGFGFPFFLSEQEKWADSSLINADYSQKGSEESENSRQFILDLENWMGNLPNALTRKPLIYLAIPGSHNSFSYSLSPTSDISPDCPEIVQQLARLFKQLTKHIVYNWSKGQIENVTTQLCSGIRYFDIRLVNRNGEIYISHGMFGGNIEKFLQEMSAFLSNHPREVVVLDFQHFYKFNTQSHEYMMHLLQQVFGSRICHRSLLLRDITLHYLWTEERQIIAVYRHSFVNYSDLCWPSGCWLTPWPNLINTNDLLNYLDKGIATRREDVGFVSQGILTPTSKYVAFHIGSSLKRLALKNNKKLSSWLDTKSNGMHGVNVVICDFVESYAFCDKVVRLNYKSLGSATEYKK